MVLYHVTLWDFVPAVGADGVGTDALISEVWDRGNRFLGVVRMPVLLAISGYLVSNRLLQGRRSPAPFVRGANSYYLYLVWTAVLAVFYLVMARPDLPHEFSGVSATALELVMPTTPLWFIFALAVYAVTFPFLAGIRPWIVVAGLGLASWAALIMGEQVMPLKVVSGAVFFGIGVFLAPQLTALTERTSLRRAILFGLGVMVTYGITGLSLPAPVDRLASLLVAVLAVCFAFTVIGPVVRRFRRTGVGAAWIGRRTLEVYVLHVPMVLVIHVFADQVAQGFHAVHLIVIEPLVTTAAVVAAALLLRKGASVLRLNWMFVPPIALGALVTSAHKRITASIRPASNEDPASAGTRNSV
ncbi:acyltransferase [Gordonia alkaliphila]|nr:acyltransferase [Gordonia alkaliphila]